MPRASYWNRHLPAIKHGNILEIAQRENEATCFGRRTPDDSFL